VLEGEPFVSPQGLDFAPDEKRLFVADYAKGVFVVDLLTKRYAPLAPAPDSTMLGIDGLYFYRGGSSRCRTASTRSASCGSS
jgi:sugar lactone lactonase YvrE